MKRIKEACFKKSQHLFHCSEKRRRRKEKGRFWQTFELGVPEYEEKILMLLRHIVSREIGNGSSTFYQAHPL